MKTFYTVCIAVFMAACGDEMATDTGLVPDVPGTYTLTAVNTACAAEFGGTVSVVQTELNVVMTPSATGFTSLSGTINAQGALVLSGATSAGDAYTCSGTFAEGILAGACTSDNLNCSVSYTKQ